MSFTINLKIRVVVLMAKMESATTVQRALRREKFAKVPSIPTIRNIYNRFCKTGSVADLPRSGRPKLCNENDTEHIKEIVDAKPKSTLSEISSIVGRSRTSIFRVLHSDMGLKSYKIEIHQKLFEEDYDRRVQTAEDLLPYINDPSLDNLIFFSHEATFHVSG